MNLLVIFIQSGAPVMITDEHRLMTSGLQPWVALVLGTWKHSANVFGRDGTTVGEAGRATATAVLRLPCKNRQQR